MSSEKILVIDDDEHIREYLKDALERENYQVETAPTGEEGIEKFKDSVHDLVFIDMILPEMNGIDVLKEVKKVSKETIAIIITGHASIENAVESMRVGAYNYLTKPLTLETLKNVISKARENQEILNSGEVPLETISINGIQTDPGFIKF